MNATTPPAVTILVESDPERPGLWLRRLREAVGLSQEDVAHLAGLSQMSVSRYECGRRLPPVHRARALFLAMGAPPDVAESFRCAVVNAMERAWLRNNRGSASANAGR